MGHKFWSNPRILDVAGFLSTIIALAVLFLPQKGANKVNTDWGSPQGVIVIILLVADVVLFGIGIFRKEKRLVSSAVNQIIEERKQTLARVRHSIESRLRARTPLITKAEKFPLDKYWEYVRNTKLNFIIMRNPPRRPIKIINALERNGFAVDNLYYQELKDNDPNYKQAVESYGINCSKIDEYAYAKLKPELDRLWKIEHLTASSQIYVSLGINTKKVLKVPIIHRLGRLSRNKSRGTLEAWLTYIEQTISELERGDDFEFY